MRFRVMLLASIVMAPLMGWLRFSPRGAPGVLDAAFLLTSAAVVVLTVRELVMLMKPRLPDTPPTDHEPPNPDE